MSTQKCTIDRFSRPADPLLNGEQPCGTCGVAGKITYEIVDGYSCGNCGSTDAGG